MAKENERLKAELAQYQQREFDETGASLTYYEIKMRGALRAIIEVTSTTSIGDHNESYIQEIAEKALASRETK